MNNSEFILAHVPKIGDGFKERVLSDALGSSSNNFIYIIILVIVVLIVVFFIILKLIKRNIFEESLKKANIYLNKGEFSSARDEYIKMKEIAEKSKNRSMIEKVISFYNMYQGVKNEK